jgi:ABC-type transport system involved in multi-copper enzyme maturation permease subunit
MNILRAEWTKARTVRSTWWSLGVATVLCVGLAFLSGMQWRNNYDRVADDWDAVRNGFLSLTMGQIALVVFGVLLASAEYSSGTIRASLTAIPARGRLLVAKLAVSALVAAAVSAVIVGGSFVAAQTAMAEHGVSLGDPGVPRAVVGAWLYLTLLCVFAAGVGMMLRSTAASLGILIPVLFLNSQGLGHAPGIREVAQYLPDQAGLVLMQSTDPGSGMFARSYGFGGALAILVAWTLAAVGGAYLLLNRRDA